ncbi:MAG: lysylphosphatidylglycerol synthase domain-containing protein [Actinomycetales bacterium]
MLRVVRPLVALLVLTAVVVAVVRTWHSVSGELGSIPAWAVLSAVVLVLAGLVPTVAAWRILMADLGSPLPWRLAAGVFFVGQLGKYLPGSLWVVLAQSDLAARHGAPRRRTAVVGLVQVGLSIVVGLALGVLAVPALVAGGVDRAWLLALVALPAGAVILHPPVLNRLVALGLQLLRREPLEHEFSRRAVAAAAAVSAVAWLLIGLQLWVLAVGLDAPPGRALLAAGFGYALAASVGLLIVFVPAGLGARDVAIVLTLATMMPRSAATAVAIVSRFVVLVADLIAAAAGWAYDRSDREIDRMTEAG